MGCTQWGSDMSEQLGGSQKKGLRPRDMTTLGFLVLFFIYVCTFICILLADISQSVRKAMLNTDCEPRTLPGILQHQER